MFCRGVIDQRLYKILSKKPVPIDFKTLLNASQYAAVVYNDGPSLIVAGAGSGKTRVLTYKIAYLIEHGYPAASILALTFTNKAADEMKRRIAAVVGEQKAHYLWAGTFHSIFSHILRREATVMGYTQNFTIYDAEDARGVVSGLIKEMQLDEKTYKPKSVTARISAMKNRMITPKTYAEQNDLRQDDMHRRQPRFHEIYALYCQRCRLSNAMDFDDLLLNTFTLFCDHADILRRYQQQFAYVLVDEYQDTNLVQHRIVAMLGALHQRVCVVGDDAQSIYSFRGADIDNMLYFRQQYKGCRLFKLEQNYRSTQTIVDAANSLIAKNVQQIPKTVFSELSVGRKIEVLSNFTDGDEAETVAQIVCKLVRGGGSYADVAVLYRTNAQSRMIEKMFRKNRIPYKIYGGLAFYQRKEIKDALAYMRLVINRNDEEAFKRVINYPARKIGATSVGRILETAHQHHVSPLQVITDAAITPLRGQTAKNAVEFCSMIERFVTDNATLDAYQMARNVVERSGLLAELSNDAADPDNVERKANVDELLTAIHEFCDQRVNNGSPDLQLADFLAEVSLLTDQDVEKEELYNRVTLMTIHSAKGLEFRYVFIVGMEEELFPSSLCMSDRELEEERRLCYVALTRAKERCYMSFAKSRFRNGMVIYTQPSRFLQDIDARYMDMPDTFTPTNLRSGIYDGDGIELPLSSSFASRHTTQQSPPNRPSCTGHFKPLREVSAPALSGGVVDTLQVGDRVRHATFGIGGVQRIDGQDGNRKAVIEFADGSKRTLLLKYARLEIIKS